MQASCITRRGLLSASLALGAGLPSAQAAPSGPVHLRAFWWGSQERFQRTAAIFELFQRKHPEIGITGEFGTNDYWSKIATQMVGGNLADLFQLDALSLSSHARAARPLDPLMPSPLDLPGLEPEMLKLGQVDGRTLGVAQGLNAYALVYESDAFAQAKLPPPGFGTSWKDFADLCVELTRAAGRPGVWAANDASGRNFALDAWLRQRGKGLFTTTGLGFGADDAREWFDYWADLRRRGGCVPADVQAVDEGFVQTSTLVARKSMMYLSYSNFLVPFQNLVKAPLALTALPSGGPGAQPGLCFRPALIWSVYARSKNPEAAARFISFFMTDPEAAKLSGVERGVPVLPSMRAAVMPVLNESERMTVDYLNALEGKTAPYMLWPAGSAEFDKRVLRPTAQAVAFGKLSTADGAKRLVDEGRTLF